MSAPSPPIITDRPDSRNSTLIFYWKPSLSDGDGSGISSYTLNCTAPSTIEISYPAPTAEGIALISPLTNRTRYFFDIYATNSNGISSPYVSYYAKQPGNPPIPPFVSTSLSYNNPNFNLTVYWSTPTNDGEADIYRYGIWMYPSDSNGTVLSNLGILSSKTYTYSNIYSRDINIPDQLSNYTLAVAAINDAGWSEIYDPSVYKFIGIGYIPGIRWNALPLNNYSVNGIYLFNTIASASTAITFDGTNIATLTNNYRPVNGGTRYQVEWTGYFYCRNSGNHTFWTNSDDWSFLWLGSNAEPGNYTTTNPLVNNGGEHAAQDRFGTSNLIANTYYFIRFSFGENSGGDDMQVSFSTPTLARTYNFSNYMYYRLT
jgi:hypothetical protein